MTGMVRRDPPLSSPAHAGDPVRRAFSVLSSASLEYLYGVWSRDSVSGHFNDLLVRRRPASSRRDLKPAGRPGGATVKGGRRPSRSDAALDGREPGARLEVTTRRCRRHRTTSEASPPWTRYRVADLYSVDPSDQYHDACMRIGGAKLRGGGSILGRGAKAMYSIGSPPPRMSSADYWAAKPSMVLGLRKLHGQVPAGRNLRPSVISPVVTSRHRAMSSLRASATIMVLRVVRRPSAVRSRNQRASRLSFWKIRKRQASWIMPRRTRPLPARANPFSRRRLPLSSGAPVSPA